MAKKIKVGDKFFYKKEERTIMKRIKGDELKRKPNMQSGVLFTGYHRKPCKYLLDDGVELTGNEIVKAKMISEGKQVINKKRPKLNWDFSKPGIAQELGDEWDHYAWSGDDF